MLKKAKKRGKGLREVFQKPCSWALTLEIAILFFSINLLLSHPRTPGEEITPQELKKNKKKYQLIDVREEWEFDDGHLEGAVNIPFSIFEWAEKEGKIPKDKSIVVYCLHGIRSGRVLEFLKAKGYTNICHLMGGFKAWKKSNNIITNKYLED